MTTRRASLWPREHGAYVQLLAPILAAYVVAPSFAGALLAIAGFAVFVAFEPFRVLAGLRGTRRRDTERTRARTRLVLLAAVALSGVAAAIVRAPSILPALALTGVIGAIVIVLAWKRAVTTLVGEAVAASALSGGAAPVLVAGGVSLMDAVITWTVWSIGYATTVIAVHHVLEKHRARTATLARIIVVAAIAVASVVAGDARALAITPLALSSMAIVVMSPSARRVRAIGVAFLIASLVSAAALIAATF